MTWKRWIGLIVALAGPLMASAQEYGYTHGDSSGTLYRVEIPSGSAAPVGDSGGGFRSFALSPEGLLFGLSFDGALHLVDTVTGGTTNNGTIAVQPGEYPTGLAFDRHGRLLVLANAHPQSALYEVDPESATANFLLWIDSDMVTSIAISGPTCYASTSWGNLFTVDLSTGATSELPGSSGGYYTSVDDLGFDGSGQLWGVEQRFSPISGCLGNYLVRFDLSTGGYTRVAPLAPGVSECLAPLAIEQIPNLPVPAQGPIGNAALILAITGLGFAILLSRSGSSA